jgi:hypothetical protein
VEFRVGTEAAARQVDLLEIGGQQSGGLVCDGGVLDNDRCRRADGPERPRGELRLAALKVRTHFRADPPDVTEGVCELALGECAEPVLPVFVVEELPLLPVFAVEELPLLPVVPVFAAVE